MTLRASSRRVSPSFELSCLYQPLCFQLLKLQHCLWIHCYIYDCEVFPAYILNSDTDLGDILDNIKNQDTELKLSYRNGSAL